MLCSCDSRRAKPLWEKALARPALASRFAPVWLVVSSDEMLEEIIWAPCFCRARQVKRNAKSGSSHPGPDRTCLDLTVPVIKMQVLLNYMEMRQVWA